LVVEVCVEKFKYFSNYNYTIKNFYFQYHPVDNFFQKKKRQVVFDAFAFFIC